MVLPLIALGAAAVAVAGTAIVRYREHHAVKRVAVLGGPQVGKTSLIGLMRDGSVPEHPEPTSGPAAGGELRLKVGTRDATLLAERDWPGSDGLGYPTWRRAFDSADHVWYLFRADRIVERDAAAVDLVTDHLGRLYNWMGLRRSKPAVLLIGTWGDTAQTFREDPALCAREVASEPVIHVGAAKLNQAPVVVGSLNDEASGAALLRSIAERI